jgi:hypothetical protein
VSEKCPSSTAFALVNPPLFSEKEAGRMGKHLGIFTDTVSKAAFTRSRIIE